MQRSMVRTMPFERAMWSMLSAAINVRALMMPLSGRCFSYLGFRVEGYGLGIDDAFVRPLLLALICNDVLLLYCMINVRALMLPLWSRCLSLY